MQSSSLLLVNPIRTLGLLLEYNFAQGILILVTLPCALLKALNCMTTNLTLILSM